MASRAQGAALCLLRENCPLSQTGTHRPLQAERDHSGPHGGQTAQSVTLMGQYSDDLRALSGLVPQNAPAPPKARVNVCRRIGADEQQRRMRAPQTTNFTNAETKSGFARALESA